MVASVLLLGSKMKADAHEPLYGIGPHVLFQGGFAPHFTFFSGNGIETEYALGYGITRNWTVIGETGFHIDQGQYRWGEVSFKQKYRFFSKFAPGISRQISAVSNIIVPVQDGAPTIARIGLTGGQEALHWYWFFSGSYGFKFSDQSLKPGNDLVYTATLGYRPFQTSYYKPDLVIFLEGIGTYQQKASLEGDRVVESGGHAWSVAPTFMLTYRNMALRAGPQIGLADAGNVTAPDVNFKVIIELHI